MSDLKSIEAVYGHYSFNAQTQQAYLSEKVVSEVRQCLAEAKSLSPAVTESYAAGLLRWAMERGATHFTHWFVPINGRSAQKHDSFLKVVKDRAISTFGGKTLAIGEPDASSFPSGGLRATHEARGYSVWDPSSPPFIINHRTGATLYIPTVYFSWKGHALDEKLPLLRANEALSRNVLRMLSATGDDSHKSVHTNSGIEQEYFLVDSDFILRRPDIVQTGRTLFGNAPPRGQALEDAYFGELSERTMMVINDAEKEMWKLGIPQTTRHKEVAPGQYEVAPIFTMSMIASDQNILVQETINRVAHHYGMEALFHEKPFAGLNGSGKHNNYSIGTDKVGTFYDPGDSPSTNLHFMLFLAATLRTVNVHGDLLRCAIASASNDHRLGANEAPPAIISAYLGAQIKDAVTRVVTGKDTGVTFDRNLDIGAKSLPTFLRDVTDRNRTSPFAFTGNKFEFRAVGSSQTPHRSNYLLNTAMADSCGIIAEEIEKLSAGKGTPEKEAAAWQVIKKHLTENEKVIFEGNGYDPEWQVEAVKRGLLNLRNTPDSLERFASPKNVEVFGRLGVFEKEAVEARQESWLEEYILKVGIEVKTMQNIFNTQILPVASNFYNTLFSTYNSLTVNMGEADITSYHSRLIKIGKLVENAVKECDKLAQLETQIHSKGATLQQAKFIGSEVVAQMAAFRQVVDELELCCPANQWPLPSYQDMLFSGQVYNVSPGASGVSSAGLSVSAGSNPKSFRSGVF
eukprot:NODE_363_length_2354_cov_183.169286_g338_i0.p1 GENE.NODE_363_length_2354_cov_183.169286_g338_i0~~NODE_363_length_2354_cov_183.169286_g338_i0.p1  ORF type:complete len:759 (+),score=146.90 NODE_363_length_2354_cov_183.169286_g338_i0:52-2277(+)